MTTKKKNIYLIVFTILFGILLVGGTYAALTGMTVTNAAYSGETACFDIEYDITNDDGSLPITGTLFQSSNPKGGLSGKVTMNMSASCNTEGTGTINLNVVNATKVLLQKVSAHCEDSKTLKTLKEYTSSTTCNSHANAKWVTNGSALKYAVYDDIYQDPISVGYVNKNGTITIYEDFPLTQTPTDYYIYIWLDGELADNSYANATFNGNVTAIVEQVAPTVIEKPTLDAGMIPVTIDADGTVTTILSSDSSWYDYDNQEWANIVLVTDDSRSTYLGTTGVTVTQSDILAYYTWIPRYKYKIPTKCSNIPEADRNIEDYPECYAPYTMSDTDKEKFHIYYEGEEYCSGSAVDLEDAEMDINYALQTGRFKDTYYYTSIVDYVEAYNNGEINDCGTTDGSTITLTSSEFNENNTFTETPVEIDIVFESATTPMSHGDAITSYRTHPAFWWDDDSDGTVDSGETVAGIWVGKFETSANTDSTCYTSSSTANCVSTNVSPRVVPNVSSLRNQTVSTQFTTSQKFTAGSNIYGLSSTSTNSHMMKNSEWGAVAYLSHSTYGINEEIYINNSYNFITGRSGGNVGSDSLSFNAYGNYTWLGQSVGTDGVIGSLASDTTLGTKASSTGNATGVYDMSGGAWEYVMGVLADNSGNPRSGYDADWNSGFNGLLSDDTSYTSGIAFPALKYYDLYTGTSADDSCNGGKCYGHALSETSGWYGDYAGFVGSDSPWFLRGGVYKYGSNAGAFYSSGNNGGAYSGLSWRSVIIVEKESAIYTISYDANGGTGSPSNQTKVYGETLTLSSTIPTREDYYFLGWSTSSTATSALYEPGDKFTVNANTKLYAVWEDVSDKNFMISVDGTQSATSTFLGSTLTRENISTITFVDNNTVSSDAVGSVDVSAKGDGSIMMWWDATTSASVYIGSNNGKIYIEDAGQLFSYLTNATSIDFSSGVFDTTYTSDMISMFAGAESLTSLDLSNFNTSNVKSMRAMYKDTTDLINLDISNFDTSEVTNMAQMFFGTSSLISLDLSNFDTSKVTTMVGMFDGTSSLTSLDLSNFDTSNVTNMLSMFYGAESLTSLDLSNFDTSKVTNMATMFYSASSLTNLDLSSFDTSEVTNMAQMFCGTSSLISLDLSNFDTSKVTTMAGMFSDNYALTSLDISNFNTSNVTNMASMFSYLEKLKTLDLSNFDTSKVTNMNYMFGESYSLTNIDLSNFDTSNVTDMAYMFYYCQGLTSLDLSSFDTSNVTNMNYMFNDTTNLHTIDFSNADFSGVIDSGKYTDMISSENGENITFTIYVLDSTQQDFIDHVLIDAGYADYRIIISS